MRKRAEMPVRRRGAKAPRDETLSELPMVTLLLVTAVVVALFAAGGPVLEVIAGLDRWPG